MSSLPDKQPLRRVTDLLTPEQRDELFIDLAEMAAQRRRAASEAALMTFDGAPLPCTSPPHEGVQP